MNCNCRKDPNTKYCPAWRVIRRQTIRNMHYDGLRLRDIAKRWGMNNIGSVVNQLGDEYTRRHEAHNVKSVIATGVGLRRVYSPINRCIDDGFTLSAVYRAIKSGEMYAGLYWTR